MRFILISLSIVLLASSLVSLLFLSAIMFDAFPLGHVTAPNGTVTIQIDKTLAISLTNETINFGTCALNLTRGYALLDSSGSTTSANNADCFGGFFPSSIEVRNVGNEYANVSVSFNETGPSFFLDPTSWLAYKTTNPPTTGGCVGNLQDNFTNITSAGSFTTACDNLTFTGVQQRFSLYLQAYVDASASGGGELLVTFSAQSPS